MKDGMKSRTPSGWKGKTEGDIIDGSRDKERSVAARGKFQGRSESGNVFTLKPNLISNLIRDRNGNGRPGLVDKCLRHKDLRSVGG